MGMRHRDFSTIEWESNMGQIWVSTSVDPVDRTSCGAHWISEYPNFAQTHKNWYQPASIHKNQGEIQPGNAG